MSIQCMRAGRCANPGGGRDSWLVQVGGIAVYLACLVTFDACLNYVFLTLFTIGIAHGRKKYRLKLLMPLFVPLGNTLFSGEDPEQASH